MLFSTNTPKTIITAMFEAKQEFKTLTKNAKGYNYTYANLENVIESIEEALNKYGLLVTQEAKKSPYDNDKFIVVKTTLCHVESGSTVSTELVIPVKVLDPQGFGSAFTYGRRYALVGLFGLVAEDDDGNATLSQAIEQKKDESPIPIPEDVPEKKTETQRSRTRPTKEERKPIENTDFTIDRTPKTETVSGQQPIIPEYLKEIKLEDEPIDINKMVTVDEYSEEQYSEVTTCVENVPTEELKRTSGGGQK